MTLSLFKEIKKELTDGVSQNGHPFRYGTLATVGVDSIARLRTVVIRGVSEELNITFYTDRRSKKVTHIKENKKVSLLLFNPDKMMQVKIEGVARIHADTVSLNEIWERLSGEAKKDYTTVRPPGSSLKSPEMVQYLTEGNYFCAIDIHPYKIECLKLDKPLCQKIRFSKSIHGWEGEFLVP
ncbi:pyridoxamine 5'-phosphate oxidase family protein [Flavobacteriaceae bacterium F89]|uniref:Pyridoxamine 5'-phosphate oxidase family protein n=1 Tax=Cerina litoralis TaxID=2874477 RepID=A0AAE3EWA7_9FLAO|nr:pyridoxamine 5'-phosphate oxidase family protein [Cerina litoralis]MCG2460821.1 pyridoxamine 5'-phosphate oxidase family protein [Cerina litoralis]